MLKANNGPRVHGREVSLRPAIRKSTASFSCPGQIQLTYAMVPTLHPLWEVTVTLLIPSTLWTELLCKGEECAVLYELSKNKQAKIKKTVHTLNLRMF
jgi:hypothetical protein